jgi:hypothetical protein
MLHETKLKSKSSLKNILLLLFIFVFGFSLKAQNSIDQIMERTDLKIDSVESLANQYFNKVGTGKGNRLQAISEMALRA